MQEFNWVKNARTKIGIREIKGPKHHELILKMWRTIKRGGIKNDETAWCAAFVGACLEESGLMSTRFEGAGSYLTWGVATAPCYGAIVLITSPSAKGSGYHVGFLVGRDLAGNVYVLGGNQNNEVNISKFNGLRIKACRWPAPVPNPKVMLPQLNGGMQSTSEA